MNGASCPHERDESDKGRGRRDDPTRDEVCASKVEAETDDE
jgi:hypothetical protein